MKAIELHEVVNQKIQEICKLLNDGREIHNLSVSDLTEKCIMDLANYGGQNHYESLGILEEAKLSFAHVVKTSIFLSDMQLFAQVNEVYASYFTADFPARETVAVKTLPRNVNVEISITAVVDL